MKHLLLVMYLLYVVNTNTDELDKILNNFALESIDATIVQVIAETGKEPVRYEGRYRAYKHTLRIDYTKPFPQIVIVNQQKILWYYPDTKELWTMEGAAPVQHPFSQLYTIKERIIIKNKKKVFYGFFTTGYRYLLSDTQTGTYIELTVDKNKGYPVKRIVYTANNVEVMREIYDDYIYVNTIWFPSTIEVIARTQNGITRNITRYYNVALNVNIPPEVFVLQLPKGVRAKKM